MKAAPALAVGAWFVVGWFVGRRSGARLFAGAVLVVGTVVLIGAPNTKVG